MVQLARQGQHAFSSSLLIVDGSKGRWEASGRHSEGHRSSLESVTEISVSHLRVQSSTVTVIASHLNWRFGDDRSGCYLVHCHVIGSCVIAEAFMETGHEA
jgi:hypothetical protein